MRVFTCTPVDFSGDAGFFARDSGLFSEGLRSCGCDSMAIMPGPKRENDVAGKLIRTSHESLRDSRWWRELQLDGLILYSWASPAFTPVAQAVAAAGIPCLVVMDTSGVISPLACPLDWNREALARRLREAPRLIGRLRDLTALLMENVLRRTAKRRMPHYEAATAIGVVTPQAALWVGREIKALGGDQGLQDKVHYLPHPQLELFQQQGSIKNNTLLSVARWMPEDWGQKNPRLLVQAFADFLTRRPDWSAIIIGKGATQLPYRLPGLIPNSLTERLRFIDHVAPEELVKHYQTSKIAAWSSRWEGQQGAAAQALCCGCSVVAPNAAEMSCFRHYVTRESGRLASHHQPACLADELYLEADAWDHGQRDSSRISAIWSEEFHATNVASRALHILGLQQAPTIP